MRQIFVSERPAERARRLTVRAGTILIKPMNKSRCAGEQSEHDNARSDPLQAFCGYSFDQDKMTPSPAEISG
jgi:hypothetical protein